MNLIETKIVLEILKEEKQIGELAAGHGLSPNQLRNWKKEFLENAAKVFSITKYVKLAHIDTTGRHHGMHSLRHSAASRMLNHGVPLNIVSEMLGHRSMVVTQNYLKISIEQLRSAGLEVSYYVQQQ